MLIHRRSSFDWFVIEELGSWREIIPNVGN